MKTKMRILYRASGRAQEYSEDEWACNPFSGCPHRCRYCYAPRVLHKTREEHSDGAAVVKDLFKRLEADCAELPAGSRLFFSFSCDPWPRGNLMLQKTMIECLEIVHRQGHSVRILSKGDGGIVKYLDASDEYWTTLTLTEDPGNVSLWEPGAALTSQRIDALKQAKRRGLVTAVSFEPVIRPIDTLKLISYAQSCGCVDSVRIGKANHLGDWAWPSPIWREAVEKIDWQKFAVFAAQLCRKLKLPYRLKDDLAACLPEDQAELRESPDFAATQEKGRKGK